MPSTSILIPCRNAAPHLRQCLESALAQQPSQIVLIDDGSTDESLEIAKQFSDRVTVEFQSWHGSQATRNRLLSLATGEYIQFLDADDYLHPGKIANQLEMMGSQIAYGSFEIDHGLLYPSREYSNPIDTFDLPLHLIAAHCQWAHVPQTNSMLFHRSVFERVKWDETFGACQGQKLIYDCTIAGFGFTYTPFVTGVWRECWNPTQQISQNDQARLKALDRLLPLWWEMANEIGGFDLDIWYGQNKHNENWKRFNEKQNRTSDRVQQIVKQQVQG